MSFRYLVNKRFFFIIILFVNFVPAIVLSQARVEMSLFLSGNTLEQSGSVQYNDFLTRLMLIDNPYAFLYLGNFSKSSEITTSNKIREDISIYPDSLPGGNVSRIFTMGPNEWLTGKKHVKKVIKSIENKYGHEEVFTTEWGCPGPEEIELNERVTVILIDTYWWLNTDDVRFGKCGIEDEEDVFIWLQDALRRNANKTVIVAGYHSVKSFGPHGGKFPLAAQLLGFPYTFYKKAFGGQHDQSHPGYKNLSNQLHSILNQFPNVIYASANENSLQYFPIGNYHQIISGSLLKQTFVKENKIDFGSRNPGIARLDFYNNGKVVLKFYLADRKEVKPVYSKILFKKNYKSKEEIIAGREDLFKKPTKVANASLQYEASNAYQKWMGENYRKVWAKPISAPVFNIDVEHEGLKILKRGGGQQTKSIRMEAKKKRQYVLRSLEKYAEGALPEEMKNTFAVDVIQDQISASNPYAAMPAAVLAEYAGVLHTNPKVVYVPNDPLLKQYKDDLGGGLFLYEERPAGNRKDVDSFDNSKEIVSTDDVLEKTIDSEDHKVDQQAVLRARILDIFINDWDRHDDQWRWASFKNKGVTTYKPIPRDRDQAFFVNQGILPRIASLDFIMPKIQNFQAKTRNVCGLAFNARYFDRTFLNEMQWDDWANMVDTFNSLMTREVINKSMAAFPTEVQPLCADTIKSILLARKTYLKEMAQELYLFLSEKVSVIGTNKSDLFEIKRLSNEETEVSVWHVKKKGEKGKLIYNRIFRTSETKEILCYAFDGEDRFDISGNVFKGPIVRLIGGTDKDVVVDKSKVSGIGKRNKVYDLKKSTVIEKNGELSETLSNNRIIHDYDRKSFKYNVGAPLASLEYNVDDGIFLGLGTSRYFQKFRRDNNSIFMADFAFRTSSFNFKYGFESISTTNGLDFLFDFKISSPDFSSNFYGMGNETKNSYPGKENDYFKLRMEKYQMGIKVQKRFGKTTWKRYEDEVINIDHPINEHKVYAGISWEQTNVEENSERYITNFENNGLVVSDLRRNKFYKFNVGYLYRNVDRDFMPTRGIEFDAKASRFFSPLSGESDFSKVQAAFSTYLSFNKYSRTVFAFRIGGEKLMGDYVFHEAAKLDGKTNLRGFRKTRFYGDESLYFNAEARVKLIDFRNYFITGELGLLFFNDIGRVWYDGENSLKWHDGYGAGFWVSPFKMAVLTTTFNKSVEENLVQINFSYLF